MWTLGINFTKLFHFQLQFTSLTKNDSLVAEGCVIGLSELYQYHIMYMSYSIFFLFSLEVHQQEQKKKAAKPTQWFSPPFLPGCLCELFLLTPLWRIFLPWTQGESLVQSKRLFRRLNYRKHLKANKKERKLYIDSREMTRWIQMLLFCSVKMTSLRKPPWSLTSCKGAETTGTHVPGKYRKLFKCLPLGMS